MIKRDASLPGYAIGGLVGGEDKNLFWRLVAQCTERLPAGLCVLFSSFILGFFISHTHTQQGTRFFFYGLVRFTKNKKRQTAILHGRGLPAGSLGVLCTGRRYV